jgi:hypothetical protein
MTRWPAEKMPPPPPLPEWVVQDTDGLSRAEAHEHQEAVNAYLKAHPEHLPEFWDRYLGLDLTNFDFTDSPAEPHVRAYLAGKES